MTIAVIVSEYDGPAEEALREITDAQSRYEGFSHVYVAETLDELPHPVQIEAVREHFGDGNAISVPLTDGTRYTIRADMPIQAQVDMAEEVLTDRGMSPTEIVTNLDLIRQGIQRQLA